MKRGGRECEFAADVMDGYVVMVGGRFYASILGKPL